MSAEVVERDTPFGLLVYAICEHCGVLGSIAKHKLHAHKRMTELVLEHSCREVSG